MITTVDLFAGAGGASLGLRRAGLRHELCVEWDEDAASTLVAAGFPGVCGDVRDLEHYEKLKHVDVLWASPPCQAFSTAGSRQGALDDRNGWPWTLDVIDHLRSRGIGPEWVICENVLGLTFHKMDCTGQDIDGCAGCYWEGWIQPEFEKRFDWVGTVVLNAADYGVPQFRRRVFLVGGPGPVRWPSPTHCSVDEMNQQTMFGPPMKQWVSIGDALGLESTGEVVQQSVSVVNGTTLGTGVPGSEPWRLERPSPAITSRDWRGARHQKFDPTRGPMTAADATWRAVGRRRLTWKECALLQGFPDEHPFTGRTKVSIYKQVGNAVCPKVSEVLGRCVLSAMETR
tara:strand:+ start:83 stop:1111 length:1029 start_codon:yes stop_codon:yes gene_type:complete